MRLLAVVKTTNVCHFNSINHLQEKEAHLMSRRIEMPTDAICSVEGCNWPAGITGLCWPHRRRTHNVRLRPLVEKGALCCVPECDEPLRTKGFCNKHYQSDRYIKYREGALPRRKSFNREGCITHVKSVAVVIGDDLTFNEYLAHQRANGGPGLQRIREIFGNWNALKLAAGLKLNDRARRMK